MKKLTKLVLVLAQMGLMGAVQAASVSLSQIPLTQPVMLGDSVSFNVNVDFSGDNQTTAGGYFQLSYDSVRLGSASFTPNTSFTSAYGLVAYTPTYSPPNSSGLINGLGFAGLFSDSGTLGTVTFSTLMTGSANLATAAAVDPFWPFKNSTGSSSLTTVSYGDATVQVSAVPVPAALWLMASGLSALGLGLRRRRA